MWAIFDPIFEWMFPTTAPRFHFPDDLPCTRDDFQLAHAALQGDLVWVKDLLAEGLASVNRGTVRGNTALGLTAQEGHTEVAHTLLAANASPNLGNDKGWTPVHVAAERDHAGVLAELLATCYVNPNMQIYADNSTPLHVACHHGHAEVLAMLLATPNIDPGLAKDGGQTPLYIAAQEGHVGMVRALLATGVDPSQATATGETPLIIAAQKGHAQVVAVLLAEPGVDPNQASHNGATPLFVAARWGHFELATKLIAFPGVDPNQAMVSRTLPLHIAAYTGRAEIVRALLAVPSVDPNQVDGQSNTALMLAALDLPQARIPTLSDTKVARVLLAADGVDVNRRNALRVNRTALHDACCTAKAEMVEVLLLGGGCRFMEDAGGMTPLDLAGGNKGVLKLFASGVDYWQRRHHGGHAPALKAAVAALLLVRQRLDAYAPAAAPLPHLPEEIWLAACGFLRSADFVRCAGVWPFDLPMFAPEPPS